MRPFLAFAAALSLVCLSAAFAQDNQINRRNRTIEVVVTETVRVEPDIAEVTLGCVTYGETHDEAYQENLTAADKIIKALFRAGVSKKQIETGTLKLGENYSPASRPVQKDRQFEAHQSWRLRLPVTAAQRIIDVAVQAGANGIEGVTWRVSDPEALEIKARATAVKKARATALEIAQAAGDKLGELLYASDTVNAFMAGVLGQGQQQPAASMAPTPGGSTPAFSLKLFPQKVEKQATIRAIFAID